MNLYAAITRLALMFALATITGFAQDSPRIPLKDIVIYLDNSASIVNTKPDRPSLPLANMLSEALNSTNSMLTDNDTVSIYNFGPDINPSDSRINVAGRDRDNWSQAIDRFRAERFGDKTTNLIKLFKHMANVISQPTDAGRLRVVIIASDFDHDAGGSSAQVLGAIDAMSLAQGSFIGPDARSFLFLLRIPKEGSSDDVVARLKERLNAQVYDQERMNGSQLVSAIFGQITRWVELRVTGITKGQNGAAKLQIQVTNPNSFSISLTQIGIAHGNGSPQFIELPTTAIIPGDRNNLELDTKQIGREIQQDSLTLYPGQSPAPNGAAKGFVADNLSWAQIDLDLNHVTVLGVRKKALVLKTQVSVAGADGDLLELNYSLKRGSEEHTPLGRRDPVSLHDGSGVANITLVFDGSLDFDHLTDYTLVASTNEQPPRMVQRSLTGVSYPGWVSLAFSLVLLLLLAFANKVAALGKGVDRLLVFGGVLFLGHVVTTFLAGPGIAGFYPALFGVFVGVLTGVALLRCLLSGFESYKSKKTADRLLTPELIARFVLWRLIFSLLLGLTSWFLIAHYVL